MIFVYCISYIKLLLLDFNDFYVFIPTLKFDSHLIEVVQHLIDISLHI